MAVLAARGFAQSGIGNSWKADCETDLQAVQALACEVPRPDESFQLLKQEDLETRLVEIHALTMKAAGLRDKYSTALASDDKEREQIRADARARFNAV